MNAYHDRLSVWRPLLEQALKEDEALWDWTVRSTLTQAGQPARPLKAQIIAKGVGTWAAAGLCRVVSHDYGVKFVSKLKDSERFKRGQVLVEIAGPADAVLGLERPFLNLAAYASGIATRTRVLVDAVEKHQRTRASKIRIAATRKTLPHYRELALHSVLLGGGAAHRFNLAGGVLIKENHIAAAGGIAPAIERAKAHAPHVLKIEVEVRDLKEFDRALQAGADIIMLDNFSPESVRSAVARVSGRIPRPLIEVSGGITVGNIEDYVIDGVDVISSGSITHSVEASDFSLLVRRTTRS